MMFKRLFNALDQLFILIASLPLPAKALVLMTFLVLPVPIGFVFTDPILYSNTRLASLLFKEWFFANNALLLIHIAAAIPAIIIGPLLFEPKFRKRRPDIHRLLGKTYVYGCLISAVTVIPLALNHNIRPIAPIGFGSMGTVWFFVTWFAFQAARNKDFIAHRRWIMRSYAMTFAFVHVNLTFKYLLPYELLSAGGAKAFQSCISWQMNLLAVEIYLAATTFKGRFAGWQTIAQNVTRWNKVDRFYWRGPKHAPVSAPAV